jgi:hypothetical protein
MSLCVKTGLTFRFAHSTEARVGDLFCDGGGWQITGIPDVTAHAPSDYPFDAVIADAELVRTDCDRPWAIRPGAVKFLAISDAFRAHITQWYPWHVRHFEQLPLLNEGLRRHGKETPCRATPAGPQAHGDPASAASADTTTNDEQHSSDLG